MTGIFRKAIDGIKPDISSRDFQLAALLLIVLIAFAVRVYDLEGQSMWSDEGLSLYRSSLPLPELLSNVITVDGINTQDTNPPFYFLLLHFIRAGAGDSIFTLRYPGVLAGVLSIPLIYLMGRQLFDPWTGLLGGVFLAISPFHVWQSQDMRNYSLLILFNLVSIYGLFRFVLARPDDKRGKWITIWIVFSLLGIYTHYYGFFILAYGLAILVFFGWRLPRRFWLGVMVIGLLLIPILPIAIGRFRAGQQVDFTQVPVIHLLSHAASVYSVGIIPGILQPWWRVLPVVALALIGFVVGFRHRLKIALLVSGYLFIPLAILILLSFINPLYNGPRHLLIGLPPFLLLVAAGITQPGKPWRWFSLLVAILVICSQAVWLQTQFSSSDLVKDDLRGAANYLNTVAQADDVIVLHDTLIGSTFDYYYDGPAPWVAIPPFGLRDTEKAKSILAETAASVKRLWFLTEPTPRTTFPRQYLSDWAHTQWPEIMDRRFPSLWLGVQLKGYSPQSIVSSIPADATLLEGNWSNGLQLHGIAGETALMPGDEWWPSLYWSRTNQLTDNYQLSWLFIDLQGKVWEQLNQPLWSQFPPNQWPNGVIIHHRQPLILPAGTPPGSYQVWFRLVNADTQQSIPTAAGETDLLLFPSFQVESTTEAKPEQLPSHTKTKASWGGLDLVGFNLQAISPDYRPGHVIPIDIYWHVHEQPGIEYELIVQLVNSQGNLVVDAITTPTRADYPTTQWKPGELLHGLAELIIPPRIKEGNYEIRLALRESDSDSFLQAKQGWQLIGKPTVTLESIKVVTWLLVTEMPPIPERLSATFGDPALAELAGYELSPNSISPGDTLELTLFWLAKIETLTNYTVFVHLTDEAGTIVAQGDSSPVNGFRPTTSWRSGEVIVDTHTVEIALDVPPGEYLLSAGFYEPVTEERPVTLVDGVVQTDNRISLTQLTIEAER